MLQARMLQKQAACGFLGSDGKELKGEVSQQHDSMCRLVDPSAMKTAFRPLTPKRISAELWFVWTEGVSHRVADRQQEAHTEDGSDRDACINVGGAIEGVEHHDVVARERVLNCNR